VKPHLWFPARDSGHCINNVPVSKVSAASREMRRHVPSTLARQSINHTSSHFGHQHRPGPFSGISNPASGSRSGPPMPARDLLEPAGRR
jgi:hypothetical protein